MTIKLNAAYNPMVLELGNTSNTTMHNSTAGTNQARYTAQLVNIGDWPICTTNFSWSSNLLTAA